MAEAWFEYVRVPVTTVKEVEVVQLTLSKEEAQFVLDYLGTTVTGPDNSLRKHASAVCSTLRNAGLSYTDLQKQVVGSVASNYFKGIQGGC